MTEPLIELVDAGRTYGSLAALHPLSLRIDQGRAPIVAVVGESGSGKTTLALMLLGFLAPSRGEIRYRGRPLDRLRGAERRAYRREVQAVFQDPFAVYNPFYRVDHALTEPLRRFGLTRSRREAYARIEAACERVGLNPADTLGRFPHQLSGGQRQRLMLARAFLLQSKLLVADEPVSMIDASLRALVLTSLRSLNADLGMPVVYITHDLTTAYHIADAILVLYRGQIVEAGPAGSVIEAPQHPYTRLLVESIPWPDLDVPWGRSAPPTAADRAGTGGGCAFAARCPSARPDCLRTPPPLLAPAPQQVSRCVLHDSAPAFDPAELSHLLQLAA